MVIWIVFILHFSKSMATSGSVICDWIMENQPKYHTWPCSILLLCSSHMYTNTLPIFCGITRLSWLRIPFKSSYGTVQMQHCTCMYICRYGCPSVTDHLMVTSITYTLRITSDWIHMWRLVIGNTLAFVHATFQSSSSLITMRVHHKQSRFKVQYIFQDLRQDLEYFYVIFTCEILSLLL